MWTITIVLDHPDKVSIMSETEPKMTSDSYCVQVNYDKGYIAISYDKMISVHVEEKG